MDPARRQALPSERGRRRGGHREYLAMLTREPELQWTVVRGRADRLTKVVFGRRQLVIPGFSSTRSRLPWKAKRARTAKPFRPWERRLSPGPPYPQTLAAQTGSRAGVTTDRQDDQRPLCGRRGARPQGHGGGGQGRAAGAGCDSTCRMGLPWCRRPVRLLPRGGTMAGMLPPSSDPAVAPMTCAAPSP
jgi:hypothetical protein